MIVEMITVLAVADKPECHHSLEVMTEDLDIKMLKVHSGREALKVLEEEEICLVLLEDEMVEMGGAETAQRIHQRQQSQHLPILFLNVSPQSRQGTEHGYNVEAVDYLFKPVVPEILRSKILLFQKLYQQNRMLEVKARRLELANQQILRQQEDLSASEICFRAAFEQSFQFMAILDVEGRVLELNHLAKKLCGNSTVDAVGQYLWNICWLGQDEENERLQKVIAKARSGENTKDEAVFEDGDDIRILSRTVSPVSDSSGTIQFIAIQGHDITDRIYAEKEKQNCEILLQQAQKMEALGVLAGGVAHDFNNILSVILGNTELARMSYDADKSPKKFLESIHSAGIQARDLVKQILSFSRQEKMIKTMVRPADVVSESLKLLRSSLPSTINIVAEIDDRCGVIFADPTQFHQVFMNLCTNAYHAMEENGGILTIRLYQETVKSKQLLEEFHCESGEYAHLVVADSGDGIDQDIINMIFDPYFTTKESGKGTGMGLAIVYGIIRGHGGAIRVITEKSKGCAFHVFIPTVDGVEQRQESAEGPLYYGRGHILVVDDEPELLMVMQVMLERLGYEVTSTTSATEALTSFCAEPERFDLMLTDQIMPELKGTELAAKVLDIKPEMPIILCTGYSPAVSRKKVLAMGIQELVFKPWAANDLSRIIRQLLERAT